MSAAANITAADIKNEINWLYLQRLCSTWAAFESRGFPQR